MAKDNNPETIILHEADLKEALKGPQGERMERVRKNHGSQIIIDQDEFESALAEPDVQETLAAAQELVDSGEFPPKGME
ncbi:hypothetical protein EXS54_01030 [Patescibacteria group bacterium]|nr:hypothetical protein [Patescibacteria group bacterium]